jgi:hypothetical protein
MDFNFKYRKDSILEKGDKYDLPYSIVNSLNIIDILINDESTKKLCIVFPSKDYAAQLISIHLAFSNICKNFEEYKSEIAESYRLYRRGDKLQLNGKAVVEWVGMRNGGCVFMTKGDGPHSGAEIQISYGDINKLQKVERDKKLSAIKRVKEVLPRSNKTALDELLKIETYGNKNFVKDSVILLGKFNKYDELIDELVVEEKLTSDYFKATKISDQGQIFSQSPLIISNNTYNTLIGLYNDIKCNILVIDGLDAITSKSDFSEIMKNFDNRAVLITDLEEINSFDEIKNMGFQVYNMIDPHLTDKRVEQNSPFLDFENKNANYNKLKIELLECESTELDHIAKLVQELNINSEDEIQTTIKFSLINFINSISRKVLIADNSEIEIILESLEKINLLYDKNKLWLEDSSEIIKESIEKLYEFVNNKFSKTNKKYSLLYPYIIENECYLICPSESEAELLKNKIKNRSTKVVSISEFLSNNISINDTKIILLAWPNSRLFNKLITSNLFSNLILLFYGFEKRYMQSYFNWFNNKLNFIKNSVLFNDQKVSLIEENDHKEIFKNLEFVNNITKVDLNQSSDTDLNVIEFELNLENSQYSKYYYRGTKPEESIKAIRIDFENQSFVYSTLTHKFLVLNDLFDVTLKNGIIYNRRYESIRTGDILALIDTDRDVLVELVESISDQNELKSIKKWTELWKIELKKYFEFIGNDFKKLVEDLRSNDCQKHPVTIRTWITDESKIGPDDDADLISIALLTKSEELYQNIPLVRKSISQMTSLRMRASDFVREMIKNNLSKMGKNASLEQEIEIKDLGSVKILKVKDILTTPIIVDKKYVNRLIKKEVY